MKALTLYQPWASLLIHGIKTVETRSWRTNYEGWLLIHAGKTFDRDYYNWLHSKPEFSGFLDLLTYPTGVILGQALLVTCLKIAPGNQPNEFEQMLGDYATGRYQWIFGGIEKYSQSIPAKGSLGLWEFDDNILNLALATQR
jgi:hypothetical protein